MLPMLNNNSIFDFGQFYLVDELQESDTTIDIVAKVAKYGMEDQKNIGTLFQQGRITVLNNEDSNKFINIAFSGCVANGDINGFPRYTLTIATADDSSTKMIGLANSDDGTDSVTNVITENKEGIFPVPADSLCLVAVGSAEYNRLLSEFVKESAELTVTAGEVLSELESASLHTDGKYYKYHSVNYPNLQGMVKFGESANADEQFKIITLKGVSEGHTGLTAGSVYYAVNDGGIATSGSQVIGKAKNTTVLELMLAIDLNPDVIHKDGSVAFEADQSMGGNKITDLDDGIDESDAATVGQIPSPAPRFQGNVTAYNKGGIINGYTAASTITGVAWDGSNWWVKTFSSGTLTKYDTDGTPSVPSETISIDVGADDVVFADNHFFANTADSSGIMYKYDTSGTQVASQASSVDSDSSWITSDGVNVYYGLGNAVRSLPVAMNTGSTSMSFDSTASGFVPSAMMYDGTDFYGRTTTGLYRFSLSGTVFTREEELSSEIFNGFIRYGYDNIFWNPQSGSTLINERSLISKLLDTDLTDGFSIFSDDDTISITVGSSQEIAVVETATDNELVLSSVSGEMDSDTNTIIKKI